MYPLWNYYLYNDYLIEILKDGDLYANNDNGNLKKTKNDVKFFLTEITTIISNEEEEESVVKFMDMLRNLLNDLECNNFTFLDLEKNHEQSSVLVP
jgi:hypothetical protein